MKPDKKNHIKTSMAALAVAMFIPTLGYGQSATEQSKKSPPYKVALVVQNHADNGARIPMAALTDALTAKISGPVFQVINPYNVVGVNQNRTVVGEKTPAVSATELAKKLDLSADITEKLERLLLNKSEMVNKYAEMCASSGFHHLRGKSGVFNLAVILKLACDVKSKYDYAGIDEKVYYDTMSDIKIWCDKTGGKGLENYGWLKNHVNFELFRLGRLQFQLYECKNRTLNYKKLPFSYGEKLIYVHIPEGERLETEKCICSLKAANEFFKKYFPDYSYRYYFCESWLLFEGNREFMSEESNIVKFMSLFNICYSVNIDEQTIERVFGRRHLFVKFYPEKTDLQRRLKKYMSGGSRAGIGIGFIKKEDI